MLQLCTIFLAVASLFFWQWKSSSLAVGTSSASGNSIPGSGNALCILFPTHGSGIRYHFGMELVRFQFGTGIQVYMLIPIPGKGDLHDYWRSISTNGDFLGPPSSYTMIRDPVLRHCHRMMAHSIARRSQAPKKFATGRKSGDYISDGQFVAQLAGHFGLLTVEILGGLTVIAPELSMIDTTELDALADDQGGQADPAPVRAPQQPPPPPPAPAIEDG
nr:hypothetical protein [Tanacetum cinerariifolium]